MPTSPFPPSSQLPTLRISSPPILSLPTPPEAPPAYTPTADVGESTLEVSPPFQTVDHPLPPPPPQQYVAPPQQLYLSLRERGRGNRSEQHACQSPPAQQSHLQLQTINANANLLPISSHHTHWQNGSSRSHSPPTSITPTTPQHADSAPVQIQMSDFARDFYAACRDVHPDATTFGSPQSTSTTSAQHADPVPVSNFVRDFYAAAVRSGSESVNVDVNVATSRSSRSRSSSISSLNSYSPPASAIEEMHHTSLAAVSDFARDFYATRASGRPQLTGLNLSISTSSSPVPHGHPDSNVNESCAPPPGPPPTTSVFPSLNSNRYPPSPRPLRAELSNSLSSGSGRSMVQDDGRPTRVPKPGHPLLWNGKVLVYPSGFKCHKCNNTGFKNFNPACPRRRCWYQHSRPYAGALIYAPWSNDNNISSSPNSGTTFQCPLPIYRPNQQHQQQQTSRAVASQTCGRYRHLLRAISSPDLSPSGSQTQRRLQRPPYYHSRHC